MQFRSTILTLLHSIVILALSFASSGEAVSAGSATFLDTQAQRSGWGFTPYANPGQFKKGWVFKEYTTDTPGSFSGGYYEVCDTEVQTADNWLISNYIDLNQFDEPSHTSLYSQPEPKLPSKLSVKIMFFQRNCQSVSQSSDQCSNEIVNYYWKTDKPANDLVKSREKFQKFKTMTTQNFMKSSVPTEPDKLTTSFSTIRLDPVHDSNTKGIYLAFKDSRSCTFIKEVVVSSTFCPKATIGLAHYPRTWETDDPVEVEGSCVAGSQSKYTSKAHCLSGGRWDSDAAISKVCQCDAGREPNASFTACNMCGQSYYKQEAGNDKCIRCPKNSRSLMLGSDSCTCESGYYRAKNDSVTTPCEQPPGPPTNMQVSVVNTQVDLTWQSPTLPNDYTRNDIWYVIKCERCRRNIKNFDSSGFSKPVRLIDLPYRIRGLQPEMEYTFDVLSVNSLVMDNLGTASYGQVKARTQQEVKVGPVEMTRDETGILVTWGLSGSRLGDVRYEITLTGPQGNENKIFTTSNNYKLQGLASGDWKMAICTRPDFEVCSEVIHVNIDPEQTFGVISPGNLAIAAGLLITVILTMLLILVAAVCCYRRNVTYKWNNAAGYTSGTLAGIHGPSGHYNLMDVSVPLDHGTMKLMYGGVYPVGQQAFVDPLYYDDIDKIFIEFAREINCNQLQAFEGTFGVNPRDSTLGLGLGDGDDERYSQNQLDRAILHHSENQKSIVRIKGCGDESNPHDLRMFAIECATMSQFYHPNVLMIHGVAFDGPRVFMCLEDTGHGSLDTYLKSCYAEGDGGLTQLQLVHLLRGVACGMQYLSELGYIHKVLCASNVLVSGTGLCKIAGFEIRAVLEEEEIQGNYCKIFDALTGWLAPEVLGCRKWSSASDVWSFGVLAWEVLSHCQLQPLPGAKSPQEVIKNLESGNRLTLTEEMSPTIYEAVMMKGCWCLDRNHRMNFAQLRDLLERAIRNPSHIQDTPHSTTHSHNMPPHSKMSSSFYASNFGRVPMTSNPYQPQKPIPYSPILNGGGSSHAFSVSATSSAASVQEWLHSLKMEQYIPLFTCNDYLTLDDLMYLESITLEELGVTSAKHRKTMMSSIESMRNKGQLPPVNTTSQGQPQIKQVNLAKESAVHVIM